MSQNGESMHGNGIRWSQQILGSNGWPSSTCMGCTMTMSTPLWAEIHSIGCTTGFWLISKVSTTLAPLTLFSFIFHLHLFSFGMVLYVSTSNSSNTQSPQFHQFSTTSQATPHNMGTVGKLGTRRIWSLQLLGTIQCIGDRTQKGTFLYWFCIKQYCFHYFSIISPCF